MNKWVTYSLSGIFSVMVIACADQAIKPQASNKAIDDAAIPKTPVVKLSENEVIDNAISKANFAYQSNQQDKANTTLKEVAVAYPNNKAPWLRMAQASYDATSYSDAISFAQEALKRDPKDRLANSIVVVSGLRLATKSLTGLRSQNEISGTLRTEAQDLAKIIRESLGESSLVNGNSTVVRKKQKPLDVAQPQLAPHPDKTGVIKSPDSGNPFEVLK